MTAIKSQNTSAVSGAGENADSRQGVKARLFKGIGAQAFGQLVNLIVQIVTVPLFLHFWGKELYGEWLLLSTIPSYFTLADLGFASAAGTEMTMHVARGDKAGALRVFQSAWVLVTGLSLGITAVALLLIVFLPISHWLHLQQLSASDSRLLLTVLVLEVFFALQNGLIGIGYRCDGNYAVGSMIGSVKRLCESLTLALALAFHGSPFAVSVCYLAIEVLGNAVVAWDVRRRSPWLAYGIRHADRKTIRALALPAISFMAFPLGNALSLQAMVTVIGITLGPAAVVLFSTSRTLTRFVAQILGVITNTVWVELSAAFGTSNLALACALHRRACQAALWAAVPLCLLLLIVGPAVFGRWTQGRVAFDLVLFGLLLAVITANSLWSASYIVSVAANRHQRVALIYVAATCASLLLSVGLTKVAGIYGAAMALLVIDIAMIAFVVPQSLAMVGDTPVDYLRSILQPPWGMIRSLLRRIPRRAVPA
jgi:O-antigen/teichoic acid export membrane protein